jgi:hypothetical protein
VLAENVDRAPAGKRAACPEGRPEAGRWREEKTL